MNIDENCVQREVLFVPKNGQTNSKVNFLHEKMTPMSFYKVFLSLTQTKF